MIRLPQVCSTVVLTFALAAAVPALAQQAPAAEQDHEAHHPAEPSAPVQPQRAPGGMGGQGMDMMQMMQRMMAMQGMHGPSAMQAFQRLDGQLAYVQAELRLTDAQRPAWDAFATAFRDASGKLRQAYAPPARQAGQRPTASELLDRRIAQLSAQLEATRTVSAAARPLYAALTSPQKRSADELVAEHMRSIRMHGM